MSTASHTPRPSLYDSSEVIFEQEDVPTEPVGKWSPWDVLCVFELEATGPGKVTVEVPVHLHTKFKASWYSCDRCLRDGFLVLIGCLRY